ncbi:hypothetical protein Pfo_028999 [Paulownia fortunei]|nr:hypothetical protein Pfo_028999 [Paulownia fortunei]
MEQVGQPSTGGEYSSDASASASWENFEESPPLPFPQRFPEFSGSLTNNEGSSVIRDDAKSCFVASTTFSFFVAMAMAFGLYASETLRLGPNTSILIKPTLDAAKGSMLYGFYKNPPLDVMITWSETHKITLPASTHKEWIYYLNEGSQINISYSVDSQVRNTGLAEWLKDPSYPNIALSWNIIHGNGSIQKDVYESSTYYIAVHLNTRIKAFLYSTTDSYYKCTPAEGPCAFQLFLSSGNAAVLTSPGRMPGMVGGDWYVKLSYGPRWVTYLVGTVLQISVILLNSFMYRWNDFFLLLINYFLNHFRRTEQDTPRDQLGDNGSERNSLLSHKDDDIPSWGSSYASVSEDEEYVEDAQAGVGQGGKPVKDEEYRRRLCAICFDAPKDCFFLPCGHCVACFGCATRIVETSGTCPICRRCTKKGEKDIHSLSSTEVLLHCQCLASISQYRLLVFTLFLSWRGKFGKYCIGHQNL